MKKRILAICILLLFMTSAIIPITFGYNVRTSVDTQEMKNLFPPFEDPPNEVWNKIFEKGGIEGSHFVQQTYDGGYIIAGSTTSQQYDSLLIKTDMDGNMLWEKTYGGPNFDTFRCLKETSDNGFIILGDFEHSYVWLVKTDENGTVLWDKKYEDPSPYTGGFRVFVLDDGYFFTARFSLNNKEQIWFVKTDLDGNILLENIVGGVSDYDEYENIIQTKDGGFLIVGQTAESFWKEYNVLLIKADENGDILWRKTYGEGYRGEDVVELEDGNYMIAIKSNDGRMGLIMTDSDGEKQWCKSYPCSDFFICESFTQTIDDGFIIVGRNDMYVELSDAFIIKIDSDGNKLWEKTYQGEDRGFFAVHVIQSSDGNYVILGETAEFDGQYPEPEDVWLVKIAPFENQRPESISIDGPSSGKVRAPYTFTFNSSVEPDGEDVYLWINWGDGNIKEWVGPFQSGVPVKFTHTWNRKGEYCIRAKAMDIYGGESDWGFFEVTMQRDKATNNMLLLRLLERFPFLERLLSLVRV